MQIETVFVNLGESVAALYEGITEFDFIVAGPDGRPMLVLPALGDAVRLRMHPGPDTRTFRCIGRLFDFSRSAEPVLRIELDMPLHDAEER